MNAVYEDRYGGDTKVIEGKAGGIHQYFKRNKTLRVSTQLAFTHNINNESKIDFKNSIGFFDRKLLQPSLNFNGQQVSLFSEVNFLHTKQKTEWIAGLSLWTDNFKTPDTSRLHYKLTTFGGFAQNTFNATEWFTLETGLRIDYNTPPTNDKLKGIVILPRVKCLVKINEHWTSRIGGGLGYKMPTPFLEEAEEKGYAGIQSILLGKTQAEKSYGGNADVNFRTHFSEVAFSINQLFFYTYLNKPLILQGNNFVNANGYITTKGAETNLRVGFKDLHAFVGYTYTDANQHFNNTTLWQQLTSRHRVNAMLMWEAERSYRIGREGLLVSKQKLSDGTTGKGYVMYGFLFKKMWEHLNVFINAENFTDRRQTRWDAVYPGTITNPVFKDVYAPLDGVVIIGGVKIKL